MLSENLVSNEIFSEAVEAYDRICKVNPDLKEECIDGYKRIIEKYPDQVAARQSLAECLISKGLIKEGLEELRIVARLNPSEISMIEKKCSDIVAEDPNMWEANIILAEAFLTGGEYRKAIAAAEKVLQKDKSSTDAMSIIGHALSLLGEYEKAKDVLLDLFRTSPYDIDLQSKYQQAVEKEIEKEISVISAKIEQDPWKSGLNLDLAKLLYRKGDLESALKALQVAVKDASKSSYCYSLMGLIYQEQSRFDLAQAQFEKILEFKNAEEFEMEKTIKANKGNCFEAQGRITEAVSMYEAVMSSEVDFGNVKKRVDYLEQASQNCIRNKMLAAFFDNIEDQKIKAIWGIDSRKLKNMEEEDLTVVSFGQGQNNQGFDKFMKGRISSAGEDFILATQLDSKQIPAYNNLSVYYMSKDDLSKAQSALSTAISEDSSNPVFRNNMAVLNILKGDFKIAEKELKAALKADKNFSAANLNMGDLERKKGNIKEALIYYKKIESFDPLFVTAGRRMAYWAI